MKGILLVDKPPGMTSHDVVDRIRRAADMRKVGHTGTLDPSATGLLILCLGQATRLSEHLTRLDKVYEGDMRLGIETDSYDMDGSVIEERDIPELEPEEIQAVFDEYTGDILQVPPMVSAVKVGGERLYKKARKGEVVEREARPVTVSEFALICYEAPLATFRVRCTRGTYVRALCHEVGLKLGCGAALDSLRRTAVGKHSVENALPVDSFVSRADVESRLLPIDDALELPEIKVNRSGERMISRGSPLGRRDLMSECPAEADWIQIKSQHGKLLALGQIEREHGAVQLLPRRVFMNGK